MSRPNSKWFLVPALVLAVVAVACGGGEEKTLLTKYFMASKIADNMTLANIATVAFDPKVDGQMGSFSIVSVSPEKVEALELKKHAVDLKAAMDEEKAFTAKKTQYQDANTDITPALELHDVQIAHIGYRTETIRREKANRNLPLIARNRERFSDRVLNDVIELREAVLRGNDQVAEKGLGPEAQQLYGRAITLFEQRYWMPGN